jgi:hypothetical protein
MAIAPPRLVVAWDVFAWIGLRRYARHWSVPQICAELGDAHAIDLSEDAVEDYVRQYETMIAARHMDPEQLRQAYSGATSLVLSIDGLQPEKGHETLYVVREVTRKRVWFAEPLLSSTNDEVRRVLARAKQIAATLGLPVAGWISDKQDAFVSGIAAEFPGVPHRFCDNHFLRDLAKPLLERDSHAKVKMRRQVRGLRTIEQAVLREAAATAAAASAANSPEKLLSSASFAPPESRPATLAIAASVSPVEVVETERVETEVVAAPVLETGLSPAPEPAACSSSSPASAPVAAPSISAAGQVVLDYCAMVRGILNDDQGGPLHPPGLRMAAALGEVRSSLQRNLDEKKGASRNNNSRRSPTASTVASPPSPRRKANCVPK